MPDHHAPDHPPPIRPGRSIPGANVELVRHPIDWSKSSDLAAVTEQRISLLGDSIACGAWYLNPGYSVHAPTASVDFFRVARHARDEWLRRMRKSLSNHGQRQATRKAEHQGRRAALLDLATPHNDVSTPQAPPEVVRLSEIPDDLYHPIRKSGHLARQLASSGVMLIDGQPIEPRTWNQTANDLLNLEPPTLNPEQNPTRPHGGTQPRGPER